MQWLVDIDRGMAEGLLTPESADRLKRRARETMVVYAVDLALFAGIAMVIGGAVAWIEDAAALAALGLALALAGGAARLRAGERVWLLANATALIGTTLAVGAAAHLLFEDRENLVGVGTALGLVAIAAGWAVRRRWPERLAVLGGWLILLGTGAHVAGILLTESELRIGWIVFHYIAMLILACGVWLDVRIVTAAAFVPMAAALSSESYYSIGVYGVAIYESTLTILQMSAVALGGLWISIAHAERIARHARLIGQLALVWINMAFWIGSFWGDVVGFHLWGPRRDDFVSGDGLDWARMRKAAATFEANALVIPPDAFAAVWAAGVLAVGAWAAVTARRAVLNIAVTFGAIHFYTQYFERLEATPEAIIAAGIIAILAAWGLWMLNRRMTRSKGA